MDRWDVIILGLAAWIAVMSLVRLMASRRDALIEHVREQMRQPRRAPVREQRRSPAQGAGDRDAEAGR
jgi:hypothetical protein